MFRRKLLVDLDNSTFDTREAHANYMNHTYGINSVPTDYINNASLAEVIKFYKPESIVTDDEALIHLGEYFHTSHDFHECVRPIDEYMPEVFTELTRKYDLIIGTARSSMSLAVLQRLFELHVKKAAISHMHFVHTRTEYGKYEIVTKRQFVESIGTEHFAGFIDDSTKEMSRMGNIIPSHLFDAWGHHVNVPNIQSRVETWKTIGDIYL